MFTDFQATLLNEETLPYQGGMIGCAVSSYLVMTPTEIARLIDTHSAPLVLYARQWCDEPEDVIQEAFIKLVRLRQAPVDAVAWLYRVVRNGAIDQAKMARRRVRRETSVASGANWFVETEIDGLDADAAVAALEKLLPDRREVIVAHYWGGLSFEQIAVVVGCSASTAHRRYSAGIDDLRNSLGVTCRNQTSND